MVALGLLVAGIGTVPILRSALVQNIDVQLPALVSSDLVERYFDTAIEITDAANPSNGHAITIAAASGINTVRLIGGHALNTAGCVVHAGDVYRCPAAAAFWTLFENGVRAQAS